MLCVSIRSCGDEARRTIKLIDKICAQSTIGPETEVAENNQKQKGRNGPRTPGEEAFLQVLRVGADQSGRLESVEYYGSVDEAEKGETVLKKKGDDVVDGGVPLVDVGGV